MKKVHTSRKVRISVTAKRERRRLRSKVKRAHRFSTGYKESTEGS